MKLAQLYKRTGRLNEAALIWRELAACVPVEFYAISELAKLMEHCEHDHHQAGLLVANALNQANTFSTKEKNSLLHRLKRLNSKFEK